MTHSNRHEPDLARVFRAESGRVISILVADCGDIQLAEDALQDACLQASEKWASSPPKNATAWLLTASKRRLIDRLRKSSVPGDHLTLKYIADTLNPVQGTSEVDQGIPDERLKLIFTCCHPALNQQAQVALTLKTVCGLTVKEIARAYLASETAMNQRLLRAKKKIQAAGIPYQVPKKEDLNERLDAVLTTIYLIYNESYSAFSGQSLTRDDLANEAIRLARLVYQLLESSEVGGLLALMLLHQSRQPARSSDDDKFIPLAEQDRSLWDQTKIDEGRRLLLRCLVRGAPGKYQLQASISAVHTEAEDWSATDWKQIRLLYLELYKKAPSPVVKLNALVAAAHAGEVDIAYQGLQTLADELLDYAPYHAAQADMLGKLGKLKQARKSYQTAIKMSHNQVEKSFLKAKLDEL